MRTVLSPYEIGSSPAALAALLLADQDAGVLTMLPAPFAGSDADAVRAAADRSPSYTRFIESWRWTGPLWRQGAIRAASEGADFARRLARASAEIALNRAHAPSADPESPPAASHEALHTDIFDDEDRFLEMVSRDLLRGGIDPGISLPIVALTERIAAETASPLVCGELSSTIWKPRPGSAPAFSFSIPIPLGASGHALLALREALADSITGLGDATRHAESELRVGSLNGCTAAVTDAATDFEHAFNTFRPSLQSIDRKAGSAAAIVRIIVSVSLAPEGQAIRQAVTRIDRLIPASGRSGRPYGKPSEPVSSLVPQARTGQGNMLTVFRIRKSAWDADPA